eukprot:CAMPEP_0179159734 /NCGR_PEP_ID=MMETSP0796-20121207/78039_1 /TAXON_ID=73915 /ORGANISM="Pyrodinium bahamense, Strain pbaha01" /LENGTH=162 /DNA_ID=CAMNT_0020861567 /DNA_START=57 /DNA_END=542 /DNA_ORIENTATION=+
MTLRGLFFLSEADDAAEMQHYDVLGLTEDAAADDIRKAYRSLALRWHPDKSPPEERAAAESLFKDLAGAYEVLRDPQRRLEYDSLRRSSTPTLQRPRSSSCGTLTVQRRRRRGREPEAAKGAPGEDQSMRRSASFGGTSRSAAAPAAPRSPAHQRAAPEDAG